MNGDADRIDAQTHEARALADTFQLTIGDEISVTTSLSVTLQVGNAGTLTLGPTARLVVLQINEDDQRPIFQLLQGGLVASPAGRGFITQAYQEKWIHFNFLSNSLSIVPRGAGRFHLWYAADALYAEIVSGQAEIYANDHYLMASAGWRGFLKFRQALQITQAGAPILGAD